VFASFASAFLLKVCPACRLWHRGIQIHHSQLLRPEFAGLLMPKDETIIFDLIERLIQSLSSSDVAIDDRHTPKLHARFLSALLSKCKRDYAELGRSQPQNPPSSQTVRHDPYEHINPSPTGSSSQVFSIAPPSSRPSSSLSREASNGGQSFEFSVAATTRTVAVDEVPTYQGTAGAYPENLGARDGANDLIGSLSNLTGEDTPATLHTLRNPTWWTHMMMPGYVWCNPSCFIILR
jgi:hypothetical protein